MDAAGYKAQAIEMANLKEALVGMSAAELLSKGFTVQELYDGGFATAEIDAAGDDGAEFQVPETYDAQYSTLMATLNPDDKSSPVGAIVGALLAIIVIGIAAYFLYKRSKENDDDASAAKKRHATQRAPRGERGNARNVNNPTYDATDFDQVVTVVASRADSDPPELIARNRASSATYGFGEDTLSDGMYLEQLDLDDYRDLPKNDVKIDSLPDDVKARLKEFNRYKNILPNPHSRIILDQVGDDTTSTFINANFIPNVGGNPKGYIAAQGPKETTLSHFWRMIWQEDCRTIVMVTGLMEGTKQKCARYWPSSLKSKTGTTNYGGIEVGVISGKHRQGYKMAELEVSIPGGESRLVKHFWFDSWPDYGVPEDTTVVPQMLEEVKAWNNEEHQPWVVHCSAGIGRTGTFIGVDMGMDQLKMQGRTDVIDLVELMRQGRGGMVQTADQCEFVYKCLEDFAVAENAKVAPAAANGVNLYGNISNLRADPEMESPPPEQLYENLEV